MAILLEFKEQVKDFINDRVVGNDLEDVRNNCDRVNSSSASNI
jgi:hypothetical protein